MLQQQSAYAALSGLSGQIRSGVGAYRAQAAARAAERRAIAAMTPKEPITRRFLKRLTNDPDGAAEYIKNAGPNAFKALKAWAKYKEANYVYIFFNLLQVALCVAILATGFTCIQEARTDFNANIGSKLMDREGYVYTDNPAYPPKVNPCGVPGPDLFHLLRLQGVYEHGPGLPNLIEPDYKRWAVRVQGGLCATDSDWESLGSDGTITYSDNGDTVVERTGFHARKLHMLATIMADRTYEPESDIDLSLLKTAELSLLNKFCDTGGDRVYSKRLLDSFGDPFTRISRAYMAAAPAFRKYHKSKTGSPVQSCLGEFDPFTTLCGNSDYIHYVLDKAGSLGASTRLAGVDEVSAFGSADAVPDVLEQLVALYALSVINHLDRTANDGQCFANADAQMTAVQLCGSIYDDDVFEDTTDPTQPISLFQLPTIDGTADDPNKPPFREKADYDINYFRAADEAIAGTYHCSAAVMNNAIDLTGEYVLESKDREFPPPPPPSFTKRGMFAKYGNYQGVSDGETVRLIVKSNCAATMQYGLYDQERLFGIPDVLRAFQYDVRPDAELHFLGGFNARNYYKGPLDESNAFDQPTNRLELYLAYRLACLTIWATLLACVVGFYIGRAGLPLTVAVASLVFSLKNKDGTSKRVVQPSATSITQDSLTILASILGVFAGYYTLAVDPSVMTYYPVTPSCEDFLFGDLVHSSGGAYVTSWGKRRFQRYNETQMGWLTIVVCLTPLVYTIAKLFLESKRKKAQSEGPRLTRSEGFTILFLFCGAALVVGCKAALAIDSGNKWMDQARSAPFDTTEINDTLGRECFSTVLCAFWASLALSVSRCSWAIKNVGWFLWRFLFYIGNLFVAFLPFITYMDVMAVEANGAWNANEDSTRLAAQVGVLLGSSSIATGILIEWVNLERRVGSLAPGVGKDSAESTEKAQDAGESLVDTLAAQGYDPDAGVNMYAPVREFKFDLGAVRIGGANATGRTGEAVGVGAALARMPLPRAQRVAPAGSRPRGQYMPMLKLGH